MAKNLYEILDVPQNATQDQILEAYAKKKNKLQLERNSGAIETHEFIQKLSELDEAKSVLLDETRRNAYNNGVPALTTGAQTGQKPENKKEKSILPKVALATCIAALAVSLIGCTIFGLSKNKGKDAEPSNYTNC